MSKIVFLFMFLKFDGKIKNIFWKAPPFLCFLIFLHSLCLHKKCILSVSWELNHFSGYEIFFFNIISHVEKKNRKSQIPAVSKNCELYSCKYYKNNSTLATAQNTAMQIISAGSDIIEWYIKMRNYLFILHFKMKLFNIRSSFFLLLFNLFLPLIFRNLIFL